MKKLWPIWIRISYREKKTWIIGEWEEVNFDPSFLNFYMGSYGIITNLRVPGGY